jgi:hypothetical protein
MIKLAASLATGTDSGTFDVLAYSGGLLRVGGWPQPVLIDLHSLEIPKSIPILDGHSNTVASMLGIGQARSDGRTLNVSGTWADTPNAQEARKVAKSMPLQASVGVEAIRWTLLEPGPFSANGQSFQLSEPVAFITGKLIEVSILPIGADSQSAVVSASGVSTMPTFEEWVKSLGFDPATLSDAQRKQLESVHSELTQSQQKPKPASASWTYPPVDPVVLAQLRAERPSVAQYYAKASGHHGPGNRGAGNLLTNAILVAGGRAGLVTKRHGEQAVEAAQAVASQGWSGLARAALIEAGVHADGMSRSEVLRAGFSNTNMPAALTESIQRLALEAFLEQSENWRMVARKVEAQDFRDAKAVRLVGVTGLLRVPKDGMITHGQLNESAHPFSVATYARMLQLNRQDVINDDLSLFDSLPTILAAEGSRLVNDLVFAELTGGLAATFFSTANKNLLEGAGSALSITSLGNAIKTLRTQTDSGGRLIGLQPAVLTVPASLEATARQVLNSIEVARSGDQLATGNPWNGMPMELVVEPRLDAASVTAWYLSSRATDGGLLAAFLRGVEGPQVEQANLEGAYLGIGMRAYLDCGAARGEQRAIVRANGA